MSGRREAPAEWYRACKSLGRGAALDDFGRPQRERLSAVGVSLERAEPLSAERSSATTAPGSGTGSAGEGSPLRWDLLHLIEE